MGNRSELIAFKVRIELILERPPSLELLSTGGDTNGVQIVHGVADD
jgi:hypothetical protein